MKVAKTVLFWLAIVIAIVAVYIYYSGGELPPGVGL
jgi:hypothetical protein